MTIEFAVSILSALAATLAAVMAVRLYSGQIIKVRASIEDADAPTYINAGDKNILVLEKIVRIRNCGRSACLVYADIWTSEQLVHPPSIHTSQAFSMKEMPKINGYYGRYINVHIPYMTPLSTFDIRIRCLYKHFTYTSNSYFQSIVIGTSAGIVKVQDNSKQNPFPDAQLEVYHDARINT